MGKNKARHILHGVLDCLPIILIPIFMIYSQNHEINDNTLQVQENKQVVVNQKAEINTTITSGAGLVISYSDDGHTITLNGTTNTNPYIAICNGNITNMIVNHYYYLKGNNQITTNGTGNMYYNDNGVQKSDNGEGIIFKCSQTAAIKNITVYFNTNVVVNNYTYTPQLFDLTDMFGDNASTLTLDNMYNWLPNEYYEDGQELVIENYETITYNDTDIMSQSFYCLYNAVDKYFNMGNVFGMKNLYTWFETNIFGGTASPSIYIVWNIVLYEFIMDLLFLLYGLFMFFIDLCKRLMEKPLNSIK